jgi:hypothetical protein
MGEWGWGRSSPELGFHYHSDATPSSQRLASRRRNHFLSFPARNTRTRTRTRTHMRTRTRTRKRTHARLSLKSFSLTSFELLFVQKPLSAHMSSGRSVRHCFEHQTHARARADRHKHTTKVQCVCPNFSGPGQTTKDRIIAPSSHQCAGKQVRALVAMQ